jgi:hypothetical protein
VWLPRGVTFPWIIDDGPPGGPRPAIWRLNVRRPLSPAQIARGETKYIGPAGYTAGLYNGACLCGGRLAARPAVMVEGEIDALTLLQACWPAAGRRALPVAVVATGSTGGGRAREWQVRLAQAPCVLLAFDNDQNGAGDKAAAWWAARLPQARRLRPLLHDINADPHPEHIRLWLQRGLAAADIRKAQP